MAYLALLLGWILDICSFKWLSDSIFAAFAFPTAPAYVVHRAVWALISRGQRERALALARDSWEASRHPRVGRDLIHLYLRSGDYQNAYKVAAEMASQNPENPWFKLLEGDICRYFLKDEDRALGMYEEAVPACEKRLPDIYPLAVVLKRLTWMYQRRGNDDRLAWAIEKFYSIEPTNFHDEEFVLLAKERFRRGDVGGAREVLERGLQVIRRSLPIREAWRSLGFGDPPPVPPRRLPQNSGPPARKFPVRTRLLLEGEDPVQVVASYVRDQIRPGDVVALSSCVAALMEGRMIMEGTAHPGLLARILSRAVGGTYQITNFAASAPMANPLSVQTLLEEVGTLRVLAGAVAGALGKAIGRKGWFYVVCGPQSAQIDDILGSLPPYDYYVIMGPSDAGGLAKRIAGALGAEAAIVDANDLGVAWAVGYSSGVNPRELEQIMADNPAGNQDQQTPIVIVRRLEQAEVSG